MLPRKWKIFRTISYLHLTIIVLLTVALYFGLSGSLSMNSTGDIIGVTLIIIISTVLITNCILNLVLLDKNYPATLPGKTHRIMSGIFFALTLLMLIILAFLSAVIISSIFDRMHEQEGTSTIWLLYIFFGVILLICLSGIYIAWNQVSLRKALRRNHKAVMENFLDEKEPLQS